MQFFEQFPKIDYDLKGTGLPGTQQITNIFFRVKILDSIKNNVYAYVPYIIKEGERIDTVAEKIYNDSSLHWLIILANDFTDPLIDWPRDYDAFNRYINSKYGSLPNATSTIHHYEKRIQRKNNVQLTTNVVTLELTEDEYNDTAERALTTYNLNGGESCEVLTTTHAITNYEYEVAENDKKRQIKLIRRDYVPQIIEEMVTLTRGAKGLPIGYRTFS